ncbi:MAG: OmpH family outer membrane protein [bacterium]|nr:OmpH family outer membrane protein [bacterium]
MMRIMESKCKFFVSLAVIATGVIFSAHPLFAAQSQLKATNTGGVAYIDSQRVVDESKAGRASLKELEDFKKKNEEELAKRDREIKELEDELQKQKMALSAEAQNKKEETIRRKGIELKRFKEDKEQELKELYFKHLNKIKEEIIQIVRKIGQEKGYTMIVNKDESIIYADPNYDITSLVIEEYDKSFISKGAQK